MRMAFPGHPLLLDRYLNVQVNGPPVLAFDWLQWGDPMPWTALAFFVVNKGQGAVVATPEVSADGLHICTVGASVPQPLTIPAGQASADPYGVDLIAPYWRLWLSGSSVCDVYMFAISRTQAQLKDLS